jgi:short-subunit dehydrogenase
VTTAIITGASMGIGRSLALAWADRKADVVLSARGKDALDEVAREVIAKGARAIVVPGDVTKEDHRLELVERAIAETGRIDVLVNNAGRGFLAQAIKIDLAQMRDLFELNVFAPLHLAQIAMPQLEKTRGTVVMMSSIAGVVAAPRYGAYAASKYALEAIALAMRSELAASGVRVVVVRPGPVATPFRVNATRAEGEAYDAPVDPKAQAPETIAELTLRAVDRGTSIVETSAYVRFASAAYRFAPPAVRVALKRMATKAAS